MTAPRLGVVMDPIGSIQPTGDSTLAILLEAQSRGWSIQYMEPRDLRLEDGRATASTRTLGVSDDPERWYELDDAVDRDLGDLDLILMRRDPPVDLAYLTVTYILDRAATRGVLVSNRPSSLRDLNEKIFASWFPDCCPPTLLTRSEAAVRAFLAEHRAIVLKPVYAMGGRSVFLAREADLNTNVIIEEMTGRGERHVLAQVFVPAVTETGDKRILIVDGNPVPHALTRIPVEGDLRANLNAGGTAHPADLDDRDLRICDRIGPELRNRGVHFAGIDVIGGYLTEINITSPTGIRQIDRFHGTNVAGVYLDTLEALLTR